MQLEESKMKTIPQHLDQKKHIPFSASKEITHDRQPPPALLSTPKIEQPSEPLSILEKM